MGSRVPPTVLRKKGRKAERRLHMIRDVKQTDKEIFLKMMKEFYSSPAVDHEVNPQNFETTFEAAMNKSPFMRALILEVEGEAAGFGLLSFTYSNEAGGMVVLIEELYINEAHRSQGLGKKYFEFVEKEYPSAKRFRLEVMQDNRKAIDLYKRIGYDILEYTQMIRDFE